MCHPWIQSGLTATLTGWQIDGSADPSLSAAAESTHHSSCFCHVVCRQTPFLRLKKLWFKISISMSSTLRMNINNPINTHKNNAPHMKLQKKRPIRPFKRLTNIINISYKTYATPKVCPLQLLELFIWTGNSLDVLEWQLWWQKWDTVTSRRQMMSCQSVCQSLPY